MIYQTVTSDDFVLAFDEASRSKCQPCGACEFFDWYDDLSDSMCGGWQLDVIGICCDWAEYTAEELIEQFGYLVDFDGDAGDDETEFLVLLEKLRDMGTLIVVEHIGENSTYLFME